MEVDQDTLKEWERKGILQESSIRSTPKESSPLAQPYHPPLEPSKPGSKKLNRRQSTRENKNENKVEKEYRLKMEALHTKVARERIKIRVGPVGERCWYTPDLTYIDNITGLWTLVEVKGPFEREDARVKRMAAAEWCKEIGFAFVYAQKTKSGWKEIQLA